jgi:hypothetical protein
MDDIVEIVECLNPLVIDFYTHIPISRYNLCSFLSRHNLEFEAQRVGPVTTQIATEIFGFYEVRRIFVSSQRLTVVLQDGKTWETLPEQIVRAIEKTLEEFGVCQ